MKVLMIDVGGTSVKLMASGRQDSRKFASGRRLTAAKMMQKVLAETKDWDYDVVSLGYPGIVRSGRVDQEPHNLADGWVGFDFESAFKTPVRVINDAAMQALANYEAGRLLFLGLGTRVGATLIADDVPRAGLAARAGEHTIGELAKQLVAIARDGLTRVAPASLPLLAPVEEIASSGRTQSDHILDIWQRHAGDRAALIAALEHKL